MMIRRAIFLLFLLANDCWSPSFAEISFKGLSPTLYDLLSYNEDASCEEHKPYLCGDEYTNITDTAEFNRNKECHIDLICPSSNQLNTSCFPNGYVPPEITYQFVHTKAGNNFFQYRFSWETLPADCDVQHYVAIYSENSLDDFSLNDTCTSYKSIGFSCFSLKVVNSNKVFIELNPFARPLKSEGDSRLKRYFKLIAYPLYEWPTLEFKVPGYCSAQKEDTLYMNAIGCSTCNGGCQADTTPPQSFSVVYYQPLDQYTLSANVSWLASSDSNLVRYYLHINSSTTKHLYWLDKTVSHVIIEGMEVGETYAIWSEQFVCGCSTASEMFVYPLQSGSGDVNKSSPSPSSSSLSLLPLASSTSSIHTSSSSFPLPLHTIKPSPSVSHDGVSISLASLIMASPDPSMLVRDVDDGSKEKTTIYVSIFVPLFVVTIVAVVILVCTIVLKRRHRKLNWTHNNPSVVQPAVASSPLTTRRTKVMLIYSTETKEKKLLEILTFLDHDLGSMHDENGRKLFDICKYDTSTERDLPSEWLEKNYKYCDYIICVIGKKFKREWNDDVRPDTPLVYAFHQLFNASFTSSANPLSKIIVVLRNKSKDEKHIPSQYFQGRKTFCLDDTDELASYMMGRPRHIFVDENSV